MSDRKTSEAGGIPVWFGQAAALTGGAIIGTQGGEGLASVISEHLNLSETTAEVVEHGLELAGAATVAFAGFRLAQQNPEKSVFVGAKALAGAVAVAGAAELVERIAKLGDDIGELREDVTSIAHQHDPAADPTAHESIDSSLDATVELSAPDMPLAPAVDFMMDAHSGEPHDRYGASVNYDLERPDGGLFGPPLNIHGNREDQTIHGGPPTDIWGNPTGFNIGGDYAGHHHDVGTDHADPFDVEHEPSS